MKAAGFPTWREDVSGAVDSETQTLSAGCRLASTWVVFFLILPFSSLPTAQLQPPQKLTPVHLSPQLLTTT